MDIYSRFESTLQSICAETASADAGLRLAVAYSGGLDSTVLLDLCARYAARHALALTAFHVHHGLSPNADAWVDHCQQRCAALGLQFEAARVHLGSIADCGMEATARSKRYRALGHLCAQHGVHVLLTAHHQDDQVETMLLQLLRGSGIAGLRGMQQCHRAVDLLGSDRLLLARPLLEFSRVELEQYGDAQQLAHIEDESNTDIRHARNALRAQIMPILTEHFPGFQARFARTAQHAQAGLELIEQLAQQDYQACSVDAEFVQLDAERLSALPDARIDNVLRYWIAQQRVQMPSSARLAEMRKQLFNARDDAQVCVKHDSIELHRYRGQLGISRCAKPPASAQQFVWQGETQLVFPAFGGILFFDLAGADQSGVQRDWLLGRALEIRPRQGGERLKLAANRPTRAMKSHYQSLAIPYWQRERLPFVFSGGDLLFAAGVGMHAQHLEVGQGLIQLRWQPD